MKFARNCGAVDLNGAGGLRTAYEKLRAMPVVCTPQSIYHVQEILIFGKMNQIFVSLIAQSLASKPR